MKRKKYEKKHFRICLFERYLFFDYYNISTYQFLDYFWYR